MYYTWRLGRRGHSDDYWDFELASGRVRVSLDGHSFEHISAINETIEEVMRAAALR